MFNMSKYVPLIRSYMVASVAWIFLASATQALASQIENGHEQSIRQSAPAPPAWRQWTIQDVVEVKRIQEIAIRGESSVLAYIQKNPSIAQGKNTYRLYEVDAALSAGPRLIMEADYMSDLSWRPGTNDWTIRADFGEGIQLYAISPDGIQHSLVINKSTVLVGGSDGIRPDQVEAPTQKTGILCYDWAPDGVRLWYSKLRLRTRESQEKISESGVLYDDSTMDAGQPSIERSLEVLGTELHVFDARTNEDRIIDFVDYSPIDFNDARRGSGGISWADASHLLVHVTKFDSDGDVIYRMRNIDAITGNAQEIAAASSYKLDYTAATSKGFLVVRKVGDSDHLLEIGVNGSTIHDYGRVLFNSIQAVWREVGGDGLILGVGYAAERRGLYFVSLGSKSRNIAETSDNLSRCAFAANLSYGACVKENLTQAPELVTVTPKTGVIQAIARPNADYDRIEPLQIIEAHWKNKYGVESRGYITYPRGYVRGHIYPALVVTHYQDARNDFASDGFQWEFPIQVFAEQGYFVLSVNEPGFDPNVPLWQDEDAKHADIEKMEFNTHLNPLATMEAAAAALVASGDVDPGAIGIAGYSRGANLTSFAIAHSKTFSAASVGDGVGDLAGAFWFGSTYARNSIKKIFGGTMFDQKAYPNYLKYADDAKAAEFNGPFLQQFSGVGNARLGVEMDQSLKDSGVPTELVLFPNESHIIFQPRHRAAAMQRNLDWFDYWLQGRRNSTPVDENEYRRWDAMATTWRTRIRGNTPASIEPK